MEISPVNCPNLILSYMLLESSGLGEEIFKGIFHLKRVTTNRREKMWDTWESGLDKGRKVLNPKSVNGGGFPQKNIRGFWGKRFLKIFPGIEERWLPKRKRAYVGQRGGV